jgi:hypothetical protein
MGLPLLEHQARVLNTALEVDADTGQLAYRTVVLTLPRQAGKTSTTRVLTTWWGLARPRNLIVSTAQTGQDAREKFLDSMDDLEGRTWFARQMRGPVRRANGSEACRWRTGTRHKPAPPTPKKGHGDTLDLGIVDEAWSFHDEAVITAMRPAMMLRDSQLWIVSTAGDVNSVLLRRHVELGRRSVAAGATDGLAYFEWSAADDADPDNPATWWSCIPTLGTLLTEERVRADKAALQTDDFERSYLNRWINAEAGAVLPWGAWLLVNEPTVSPGDPVWLAADINPDRDMASIAAAGPSADGTSVTVEVVDTRPGTEWLPARLDQLRATHDVAGVVIDGTGPAATLEADLVEPPAKMPYTEVVVACQAFYDSVVAGQLQVRTSTLLNGAVRSAVKLGSGDGAWRWGRKRSKGDISPLMAATCAWWKARAELGVESLRIW